MTGEAARMRCSRCNTQPAGLERPPFPSTSALASVGERVQQRVCPGCWDAWLQTSVKLINEFKLSLHEPAAREQWLSSMLSFLDLSRDGRDPWSRFLQSIVVVESLGSPPVIGELVALDAQSLVLVVDTVRHVMDRDTVVTLDLAESSVE